MGKAQVADFVIFESGLLPGTIAICAGDMTTTYFSPVEARKVADILYALAADVDATIVRELESMELESQEGDGNE